MKSFFKAALLIWVLFYASIANAETTQGFTQTTDKCRIFFPGKFSNEKISWSGGCVDGSVEGVGVYRLSSADTKWISEEGFGQMQGGKRFGVWLIYKGNKHERVDIKQFVDGYNKVVTSDNGRMGAVYLSINSRGDFESMTPRIEDFINKYNDSSSISLADYKNQLLSWLSNPSFSVFESFKSIQQVNTQTAQSKKLSTSTFGAGSGRDLNSLNDVQPSQSNKQSAMTGGNSMPSAAPVSNLREGKFPAYPNECKPIHEEAEKFAGRKFSEADLESDETWLTVARHATGWSMNNDRIGDVLPSELSDAKSQLQSGQLRGFQYIYTRGRICLIEYALRVRSSWDVRSNGAIYEYERSSPQGISSTTARESRSQPDYSDRQKIIATSGQPAHECLSLIKEDALYGGFRNSCNFKVHYTYCAYHPKKGAWVDSVNYNCESSQYTTPRSGGQTVGANGADANHTNGAEKIFWFACKEPAHPYLVKFDGRQLIGMCKDR